MIVIKKITIASHSLGNVECPNSSNATRHSSRQTRHSSFPGYIFETPKRHRLTIPRRIPSWNACQLNAVPLRIQAGCVSESRIRQPVNATRRRLHINAKLASESASVVCFSLGLMLDYCTSVDLTTYFITLVLWIRSCKPSSALWLGSRSKWP